MKTCLSTRLSVFSAAPHRMYFFFGGLSFIASMSWWFLHLSFSRFMPEVFAAYLPAYAILPYQLHGVLMVFGLFTFFILGFLSTAFPRWMNRESIPKSIYAPSSSLMCVGYLGLLFGASHKLLWLSGGLVFLAGWLIGILGLLRVFVQTETRIGHGWLCLLGNMAGWLLLLSCLASMSFPQVFGFNAYVNTSSLLHAAIWWFLMPVFFAVSHRMLPFFTQSVVADYKVYRPVWALWMLVVFSGLHPILNAMNLALLSDLLLLITALHLSIKWKPVDFPLNPLMTSLHIAFFWLSISLGLFLVQDTFKFLNLLGWSSASWIGEAPLHALTIGFFTSMLMTMVTRVTQGHSGGRLVMSALTWRLFFAVQLVAFIRVLLDIPFFGSLRTVLLLVAAAGWVSLAFLWFMQYGPQYLKPRSDGKPG